MEIRRTANAGVLLKLDGVSILLDGVSQRVDSYLATPPDIKEWILNEKPDAFVFTHNHIDHYDPDFAKAYLATANGVIIGPEDLEGRISPMKQTKIGSVLVTPVKSRHIGKNGEIEHYSYVIEGTRRVWFFGDASPLQWQYDGKYHNPDVIIAPFAYASTISAWSRTKKFNAQKVIVTHLPEPSEDVNGLNSLVSATIQCEADGYVLIPKIGESISI